MNLPLRVHYLVYGYSYPKIATIKWGFLDDENKLLEELKRIKNELEELEKKAGFPIEFIGGEVIKSEEEAIDLYNKLLDEKIDAILIFGASLALFKISELFVHVVNDLFAALNVPIIMFIKEYQGPVYGQTVFSFFYNARLVAMKETNRMRFVFDDYDELLKALRAVRAYSALKKTKALCIGIPNRLLGGYDAIRGANNRFGLEVRLLKASSYVNMIRELSESECERAREVALKFLSRAKSVVDVNDKNAFEAAKNYIVMKRLIDEGGFNAITINCLEELALFERFFTTPCIAISLLNDEGITAACSGDIPSLAAMIVLSAIANKPGAMGNPIVNPVKNTLIISHCTAPTKMYGYEESAAEFMAMTHHETDQSVGVRTLFREGDEATILAFSHDLKRAIIARGTVINNPKFPICRTQVEFSVENAEKLFESFPGEVNTVAFHLTFVIGDYIKELKEFMEITKTEYIII